MQSVCSVSPVSPASGRTGFLPFRQATVMTLALVVLFGLTAEAPVQADDTAVEIEDRYLHEFKQCTSTCQVELDQRLWRCPEYSDDSDNLEAEGCRAAVRRQYQRCLELCPADPRPDEK